MRRRISRRHLLRGAGRVAISLPFLEAMGIGTGCTGSPRGELTAKQDRALVGRPQRFIAIHTPAGVNMATWFPIGAETAFTLNQATTPLEPHKSSVIFLKGMHAKCSQTGAYHDGHGERIAAMLTGRGLSDGNTASAEGRSIDQVIANTIGAGSRFPSLELGTHTHLSHASTLAYTGPSQPLPRMANPSKLFTRLFGTPSGGGNSDAQRQISILDGVRAEYAALQKQLGAADQLLLDAHLTSIREVERRLAVEQVCNAGTNTYPDLEAGHPNYQNQPAVVKGLLDLMVLAMSCDLTRVITLVHRGSGSYGGGYYPWLNIPDEHHDVLSHLPPSNTDGMGKLTQIDRWYVGQLAYLIDKLKTTRDAVGSLFETSLIFTGTDVSHGAIHSLLDMPYLLAGNAGGYFRTGRYLQLPETSLNDLLVSILNAFGVSATTYGHPAHCTGPIAALR